MLASAETKIKNLSPNSNRSCVRRFVQRQSNQEKMMPASKDQVDIAIKTLTQEVQREIATDVPVFLRPQVPMDKVHTFILRAAQAVADAVVDAGEEPAQIASGEAGEAD